MQALNQRMRIKFLLELIIIAEQAQDIFLQHVGFPTQCLGNPLLDLRSDQRQRDPHEHDPDGNFDNSG